MFFQAKKVHEKVIDMVLAQNQVAALAVSWSFFWKKFPPSKKPPLHQKWDWLDTCFLYTPRQGWQNFLHSKNRKKKTKRNFPGTAVGADNRNLGPGTWCFFHRPQLREELRRWWPGPRELRILTPRPRKVLSILAENLQARRWNYQMCWDLVVRSRVTDSDEESYRKVKCAFWIWVANRISSNIMCKNDATLCYIMLHYCISRSTIMLYIYIILCCIIYYGMSYYLILCYTTMSYCGYIHIVQHTLYIIERVLEFCFFPAQKFATKSAMRRSWRQKPQWWKWITRLPAFPTKLEGEPE